MISEKKLEALEKSAAKLTVTIEKEAVKKEYRDLLDKYSKTVQIKGFRRGKVPASILEQKFGESLKNEAGMNLVENGLKEAFEDLDKTPLQLEPPTLENEEISVDIEKDFTFTVTFDVFPDIELGKYKKVDIEESTVSILAADVERELKGIQDQNSVVTEKTSGAVEKEDIVTIDYVELGENDEESGDTARQDFVFTVGSGYNRFRIDDDLIGLNNGEQKIIDKEFPADFEDKELAGSKVKLKVKVTQIKEKQLPAIDDELAQDVSDEFKTLDDLKKNIKKRLKETADGRIKQRNITQILKKIVDDSKIELPESMLQAELDASWRSFLSRSGIDENRMMQILEQQNQTKEAMVEQWRDDAAQSLKSRLLMTKIIEEEKLEISEDELEQEIKIQAEQSNMPIEQARENIEKGNMMDYFRNQLLDRKLYDFLLEHAEIKKGEKIKYLDLMQAE